MWKKNRSKHSVWSIGNHNCIALKHLTTRLPYNYWQLRSFYEYIIKSYQVNWKSSKYYRDTSWECWVSRGLFEHQSRMFSGRSQCFPTGSFPGQALILTKTIGFRRVILVEHQLGIKQPTGNQCPGKSKRFPTGSSW